jgi:hypothetical protein
MGCILRVFYVFKMDFLHLFFEDFLWVIVIYEILALLKSFCFKVLQSGPKNVAWSPKQGKKTSTKTHM